MVEHANQSHRSADDEYAATPPGAGYEHTDATVAIIVKFLLWLAASAVIIHVGLALLFGLLTTRRIERGEPRFPLAVQEEPRLPPEPRLQRFPREDILNFRLAEESALRSYGWVDKDAGTVRIPIDEAMRLVLERKLLPSRPAPPPQPPDMAPSDASAGRTLVRR
ncbi:MAG: hypothetical protein ACRD26_18385 [Vicinamibacterales bacterium]